MADSVTFRFSGGDAYVISLNDWRDRLRAEVHRAAVEEANLVASVVSAQYPLGKTGKLRAGVRVQNDSLTDTIQLRVRSLAPHSHLVERGTAIRRTSRGWLRGAMPNTPIFIPEAILRRQHFKDRCRQILGSPEPQIGSGNPTVTGSL